MDLSYNASFDPKDSVIDTVLLRSPKSTGDLSIIVPPWHAEEWLLQRQSQKQLAKGNDVLYIRLDDNILSSNSRRTVQSYEAVSNHLVTDIPVNRYDRIHWVATSLGVSVMLFAVAEASLPSSTFECVAPGGDLAASLWTGRRTEQLRHQFEQQGQTLEGLQEEWAALAPTYNALRVTAHAARLRISAADEIIQPETAFGLAAALQQNCETVVIEQNKHMGHYGTILLSLL